DVEPRRLDAVGAARGHGRPHPDGRAHRRRGPAEHGAADGRRPPGHARLHPHEARGRPGPDQRPRVPELGAGRRGGRRARARLCDRPDPGPDRAADGVRVRVRAADRGGDDLLLLADPDDGRVLDRPDGRDPRAVGRDLPVGAVAGDDLPGLAPDLADIPRSDRLRGHGPGRGPDRTPDARDAGDRDGLRVGAGADLAVVVAVRAEALRGRLGLSRDIRRRLDGRYASRTMNDRELGLPPETEMERTVRIVRRLDAPPERVCGAWSDPDELARWFPRRVEGGLAVGVRTTLVWTDKRV